MEDPWMFEFFPDKFKPRKCVTELLKWNLVYLVLYHDSARVLLKKTFFYGIPDEFKTQKMCEKAVEMRAIVFFEDVLDYIATRKMFELCKYAEEEKGWFN